MSLGNILRIERDVRGTIHLTVWSRPVYASFALANVVPGYLHCFVCLFALPVFCYIVGSTYWDSCHWVTHRHDVLRLVTFTRSTQTWLESVTHTRGLHAWLTYLAYTRMSGLHV